MSLVSYFGLTAVVLWLSIILRPTEATCDPYAVDTCASRIGQWHDSGQSSSHTNICGILSGHSDCIVKNGCATDSRLDLRRDEIRKSMAQQGCGAKTKAVRAGQMVELSCKLPQEKGVNTQEQKWLLGYTAGGHEFELGACDYKTNTGSVKCTPGSNQATLKVSPSDPSNSEISLPADKRFSYVRCVWGQNDEKERWTLTIYGLSPRCQWCEDQFKKNIEGVKYKDNKDQYCNTHEKFFECLDLKECDPKIEDDYFHLWSISLKSTLMFMCDFAIQCKLCMATFNTKAETLHSDADKTSLCRINREFVKCSKDYDCTKGQLGNRYAPMVASANATIYFACGADVCYSGPADRCHHNEHMSLNRDVTKDMTHDRFRCVMAARFANCIKENGCTDDPDKQYQMETYKSVLKSQSCQCNPTKADECLDKEDERQYIETISKACLLVRNKKRCIHDHGCTDDPRFANELRSSRRMVAHFRCPGMSGWMGGGVASLTSDTNDTILNAPGKAPKNDDADTDKKDEDDGASSCYASWVMILLVAMGMIGQC